MHRCHVMWCVLNLRYMFGRWKKYFNLSFVWTIWFKRVSVICSSKNFSYFASKIFLGMDISTTSESIYRNCIEQVEKLVQNLYIAIRLVIQNCITWPTLVICFVAYFRQGEELQLPFYIWWFATADYLKCYVLTFYFYFKGCLSIGKIQLDIWLHFQWSI